MSNQDIKLIKLIKLIGYNGVLLDENKLKVALTEGPSNIEFTILINYLTNELRVVCNLDEIVNVIKSSEDAVAFMMEINSFLNELGCPHTHLTRGNLEERLSTTENRILLIEYLITELMAARILSQKRPEKNIELKLKESSHGADLRKMLQALGYPRPPTNITISLLMKKLLDSLEKIVLKAPKELIGKPIFNGTLTESQWEKLSRVQQELFNDYSARKEMLLTRLDCTVQSFQWSDKAKGKEQLFKKAFGDKRQHLKVDPEVDLSDLLYAREALAIIEKTSNALVRKNTKSTLNSLIIGQVPDRGGRTSEHAPPAPEMPPWQQRSVSNDNKQFNRRDNLNNQRENNYNRMSKGTDNYSSSYNSGSSSSNYSQGDGARYSHTNSNYSSNDYNQNSNTQYYRGGNYGGGFDSAGSYGNNSHDYQEPKRVKTFDRFQSNKTSYADQYVQDNQQNQQYHPREYRGRGGQRGNSNYNRGRGQNRY